MSGVNGINPEEVVRVEEWVEEMTREEVVPEALTQLVTDSLELVKEDPEGHQNLLHDLLWLTGQR